MQWDSSPNAGFCPPDVEPWLPLAADAPSVNVAGQAEDPDSLLTLTRRLIQVRREHPVLHRGDFEPFGPTPDGSYAFRRRSPAGRLVVALNLSDTPVTIPSEGVGQVLIGTHRDRDGSLVDGPLQLRANEAVVVEER